MAKIRNGARHVGRSVWIWAWVSAACAGNAAPTASNQTAAGTAAVATPQAAAQSPRASAASTPAPTAASSATQTASPPAPSANPMASAPAVPGTAATPAATPPPSAPTATAPAKLMPPCDVRKAVTTACGHCHGATPVGGAPMPLVTADDFQKPAVTQPSMKVYQLALARMNDAAKPMPPSAAIDAGDKSTIMAWLGAGGLGQADTSACETAGPVSERATSVGLTAREGETCYDLQSHGAMTPGDTTPYAVPEGEHYEQFYFKVPWPADSVATRFGGKLDNIQVLHHWLLFSTGRSPSLEGTHEASSGSQLGDDSHLLAGWALGGDNIEFPQDMGLTLPASGMLNASWHYYNRTNGPANDTSSVQVCVVNKAKREKTLSMSFLGTENLGGPSGMPAHQRSEYSGTCQNRSAGPVTIWGVLPHMHKLGRHMKSVVTRTDASSETVFDKAFDFNSQIHYPLAPMLVLQPGDRITSTCTFDNDTNSPVAYGPSSDQEMCYQFVFAYPAGALDNHVFSLTGDKNTCWGD